MRAFRPRGGLHKVLAWRSRFLGVLSALARAVSEFSTKDCEYWSFPSGKHRTPF